MALTLIVSIHAPAWGATRSIYVYLYLSCFNPRARVGRDPLLMRYYLTIVFQSTRPRGARPTIRRHQKSTLGFNPRARVGRDHRSRS
mgnify:CR=1 FL=1